MSQIKKFKYLFYVFIIVAPIISIAWPNIPSLYICASILFLSAFYCILDVVVDKNSDDEMSRINDEIEQLKQFREAMKKQDDAEEIHKNG